MSSVEPRIGRTARTGALGGLAVAGLILVAVAVVLTRPEHVTAKALVPVWLAALPVAGLCAGIGYAAGRLVGGASAAPASEPAVADESHPSSPDTVTAADAMGPSDASPVGVAPGQPASRCLRLGIALEQRLARVEAFAAGGPLHAVILGTGLGIATIVGGVGLFVIVWAVLVNFLA